MPDKKRQYLHIALIILIVAAVYGNSLLNGFVWDDTVHLVGNRIYKEFDLKGMFLSLANGREYLPLRDVTYGIDYLLWGENPFGFHLTNLVLYAANLVAAYFMLLQIRKLAALRERLGDADLNFYALLTVLLFAVHPIHCEAVAWVTGRNVLLSGLFFFLSCGFYAQFLTGERKGRSGYYAGALICYLCALLSKSTAIVAPLLLVLFIFFDAPEKRLKKLVSLIPFFLLMLGFYLLFKKIGIVSETIATHSILPGSDFAAKVAVSLQIPFFYLQKLFFPVNFSAEYDTVFALSILRPATIFSALLLLLIISAAIAKRKKYPEFLFGVAWFLLTLIPVLHLLPTNPFVADRYAYLPSFAPFFGAAILLGRLSIKMNRRTAAGCAAAFLLLWSGLAIARNPVWRTEKSLWEDTLEKSPLQMKAYYNLGNAYFQEGNYEKAFYYFRKIRGMHYNYDYYALFTGELYFKKGNLPAALDSFKEALAVNEDHLEALIRVANIYERLGKYDQALLYYNRVLNSRDHDTEGLRDKVSARILRLRKTLGRLDELRIMHRENPSDRNVEGELALTLDELGSYDEALDLYLKIEKHDPGSWKLLNNIAKIYFNKKRYREAALYYERSLAINPSNAEAVDNLQEMKKSISTLKR